MRILALRGENIASLKEFAVDFQSEPLRSAGVFAIVGPTGSGKSSLLDALCLALYLNAPRLDDIGREAKVESRFGEITQSDIRNLLRRGSATGFCECDFLADDGESYRARWGLRAAKRTGAAPQEETSLVRLSDGAVLSSGRKSEYLRLVEEKLGLSYQQFTRTVLLAQGRFAQFLRSGEDERAALLERLTGTEVYRRISVRVFERTREARDRREGIAREMGGLALLPDEERAAREARRSELAAASAEHAREEEGLRTFLERLARLETLAEDEKRLEAEVAAQTPRLEALRQRLEVCEQVQRTTAQEREAARPDLEAARHLDAQRATARKLLDEREGELRRRTEAVARLGQERSDLEEEAARTEAESVRLAQWLARYGEKLAPLVPEWPRWRELLERLVQELPELERAQERLAQAQERHAKSASQLGAQTPVPEAEIPRRLEEARARLESLRALPARLRLEREEAEAIQALAQEEAQQPRLEMAVATSEAAWDAIRRLLETTKAALSGNVSHLRAQLSEGAPCPVCGSTSHPWSEAAPALDAVLSAQEAQGQEARQALDAAKAELARSRTAHDLAAQRHSRLRSEMDAEPGDAHLLAFAHAQEDPLTWCAQETAKAAAQETAVETSRQLWAQAALVRQAEAELARLRHGVEAAQEALDTPFGGQTWREKLRSVPDFLARTAHAVEDFRRYQDERAGCEEALAKTRQALARTGEELATRSAETEAARQTHEEALKELASVEEQRRKLLSGRSVDEVETGLETACAEAEVRLGEARKEAIAAEAERAQREGRVAQLSAQLGRERETFQSESLALFPEPPQDPPAAARERFAAVRDQLKEERSEAARIEVELERDARDRTRGQELSERLAEAGSDLEAWELLNARVGSADGKRFSALAQSHTLEILLEETNRRLALIAPRYRLEAIAGTMGLLVMDRENFDERRPVPTLSGGESFLVSLGLALGLSGLAGGDLSVESLFIDEGFGTLDPESLRHVLAALGNLQAQGRKVGLITHVEEMKAEIPVHVEIVPLGQGSSWVRVVG